MGRLSWDKGFNTMAKTPRHHIPGMVLSLDHHFCKLLNDLKSPNVLWQTVKEGPKVGMQRGYTITQETHHTAMVGGRARSIFSSLSVRDVLR